MWYRFRTTEWKPRLHFWLIAAKSLSQSLASERQLTLLGFSWSSETWLLETDFSLWLTHTEIVRGVWPTCARCYGDWLGQVPDWVITHRAVFHQVSERVCVWVHMHVCVSALSLPSRLTLSPSSAIDASLEDGAKTNKVNRKISMCRWKKINTST